MLHVLTPSFPTRRSSDLVLAQAIVEEGLKNIAAGANPMIMRRGLEKAVVERSEEHTSELQSLMRTSYAVFCLKKKNEKTHIQHTTHHNYTSTSKNSKH